VRLKGKSTIVIEDQNVVERFSQVATNPSF
jgi:hypothetical protein